jgi:hypothetical protein
VGLTTGIQPNQKGNDSNGGDQNNKKAEACKCESMTHQRTTHQECPLNASLQPNPAMLWPLPIPLPPPTPAINLLPPQQEPAPAMPCPQ